MAIPSLLSMAVDGSTLALYFSEPIKSILPSRNRFQVLVNGVRNFTSADATLTNGDTIRLALTTPIPPGATVSVSYLNVNGFDRFGYGDIRSISTNQTAAFFRTRVTSNLTGTPAASVAISSSTASLKVGETATITFSFSREPGSSFSSGDISLSGGTLSALSGSGLTRTAVFTPTAGSSGTASITVGAATYTDIFGNSGSAGITPALSYDTLAPTLAITSSTAALNAGQTATITFTFSEAPSDFVAADISATGGSISGLAVTADPKVYTATFTPTAGSSGTASITVPAGSYTDAAGNPGGAGTTPALSYDTTPPTLAITSSSAALNAVQTATITFSFSEDPGSSFLWDGTTGDVVLSGGTLSAISGSGLTRTATFTPTAGSSGTASITVAAGSYTDAAGNPGGAGATPSLSYDTLAPTLTITSSSAALIAGQTATITFTFSEDPGSTFTWNGTTGDVVVTGGTLGAISGTGLTRTATFTPTASLASGTASITVAAGSYTDTAGNPGAAGTTPSITIDTLAPTVSSVVNPASAQYVLAGGTLSLTLNFSETVNLSNAGTATITAIVDLAAGGTANVTLTATGTTITAAGVSQLTFSNNSLPTTLTDTNGVLVTANSLAIISGTFTDNAGNSVSSTFSQLSATNQLVDTVVPTLSITTPISTDGFVNNAEDESSLIISGTSSGADGRTVTVVVGSITGQTATIATGGAWSIALTSAQVKTLGLPRFQGQVDRGHAMTTRLSIDELTHQDQASIHGAAKGGGC